MKQNKTHFILIIIQSFIYFGINAQVMVKDIYPGNNSSSQFFHTKINNNIFFGAFDSIYGGELWKTDGTAIGTLMVKDIKPGAGTSIGTTGGMSFVNSNGILFFTANDGINGMELWKSDGTFAGTVMVKDIFTGITGTSPNGSNPNNYLDFNGTLFFNAYDPINGSELWKSDGTPSGTVLVKDIVSGSGSSGPQYLTKSNGILYFSKGNGQNELWKTDGSASGTLLVKSFGSNGNAPSYLIDINNTLFFRGNDGANGVELWKSDGSSVGTVMVKDIKPGTNYDNGLPFYNQFCNVNGVLYFVAQNTTNNIELWKTDGTSSGTVIVKEIYPGSPGSGPQYLTNVNGTLFFIADDGIKGVELWKSDGTTFGTLIVKDIVPGSNSSLPDGLINIYGNLYFSSNAYPYGNELWKSDGTDIGTINLTEICLGSCSSYPSPKLYINSDLFLTASDGLHGQELWKYEIFDSLNFSTNNLHFAANSSTQQVQLTSNRTWIASGFASWLSITPNPGNGNTTVNLTANTNSSSNRRSSNITFTAGTLTKTITVVQDSTPIFPDQLTLNKDSIKVTQLAANTTVQLQSNRSWTITNPVSWVSITPMNGSNNATLNVSIQANGTTSARTTNIIVTAGSVSKQIHILQDYVVGINELQGLNQISIYPNPSSGVFTFENKGNENCEVQVFNVNGKLVDSFTTIANSNSVLDYIILQNGLYLMQVRGNDSIKNIKLLISK